MTAEKSFIEKTEEVILALGQLAEACDRGEATLSALECDLLKERLRALYLKLIGLETGSHAPAQPAARQETTSYGAEENILVFVNDDEPAAAATQPMAEPAAESKQNEQTEKAAAPAEEPKPAAAEKAEKTLFADEPTAPEPMEPVMDQIEGNPFENIFGGEQPLYEEATPAQPAVETEQTPPAAKADNEISLMDLLNEAADKPAPQPAAETHEAPADAPRPTPAAEPLATPQTIAERLGQHAPAEEPLGSRINHSKVSDLRTIININDKFSFMTDLFKSNMKAYNDFILRLNAIDDRQTALEHVKMIARDFGWDMESLAAKTFFSIFDRKF